MYGGTLDHYTNGLFTNQEIADRAMNLVTLTDASSTRWVRPVLMKAISADGTDYVEVDVRKCLDKIAQSEPLRIAHLCGSWFGCTDADNSAYNYRQLMREADTDTHLFLLRMDAQKKGWTCSIDRKAAREWIMNTQPNQRIFLDPLMVEG